MREPQMINWAGGENPFLLRIGEMLALEKACGTGIGAIFGRVSLSLAGGSQWHVADITETLRLGLIGGGASREDAQRLVATTVDRAGLMDLVPVAATVLLISLQGEDEDQDDDPPPAADDQKKKETPPPD